MPILLGHHPSAYAPWQSEIMININAVNFCLKVKRKSINQKPYLPVSKVHSYDLRKGKRWGKRLRCPSGDSLSGLTTCWSGPQLEVGSVDEAARLIHRIRILLNGSKMNESISYQNQVYFCLNVGESRMHRHLGFPHLKYQED